MSSLRASACLGRRQQLSSRGTGSAGNVRGCTARGPAPLRCCPRSPEGSLPMPAPYSPVSPSSSSSSSSPSSSPSRSSSTSSFSIFILPKLQSPAPVLPPPARRRACPEQSLPRRRSGSGRRGGGGGVRAGRQQPAPSRHWAARARARCLLGCSPPPSCCSRPQTAPARDLRKVSPRWDSRQAAMHLLSPYSAITSNVQLAPAVGRGRRY